MSLKGLLTADTGGLATSIGLFLLRVFAGLSLFLKHGLEKLGGYSTMVQHFPDPIHIGAHASLAFALLSDGICSLLVILGVATRLAALIILINVGTAFLLVHHAAFFSNRNVELVALYAIIFAAIVFTGPGRFSIDYHLKR